MASGKSSVAVSEAEQGGQIEAVLITLLHTACEHGMSNERAEMLYEEFRGLLEPGGAEFTATLHSELHRIAAMNDLSADKRSGTFLFILLEAAQGAGMSEAHAARIWDELAILQLSGDTVLPNVRSALKLV